MMRTATSMRSCQTLSSSPSLASSSIAPMSSAASSPITRLALIGGSSFLASSLLSHLTPLTVDTTFGSVLLRVNNNRTLVFVQRHAADPDDAKAYSPPHLINYRAIAKALQQLNVSHVIAFGSTGSLKKTLPVGQILVPDDWIHFTPISTFGYAKGGHVGTGLDSALRLGLLSLLRSSGFSVLDSGVYVQTLGPRFETPAEIRSLAIQGGDIVGMTCAHEATLCKELGLPYAVVCIIDNMANGIAGTEISYEEFHAGVAKNLIVMEKVLSLVLDRFTPTGAADVAITVGASASSSSSSSKIVVDSLIHARWVVPILPAGVLEHHTLAIRNGLIVDVLPSVDARLKYSSTNEEEYPTDVVMPGLINAHSHLGMSLMRGYADDHCLIDWLLNHIWPAEAVFVSPAFVRDSCMLGVAEMIRGGTTACNDMYWYPEVFADVADKVGLRALIGLIYIDFPTNYGSSPDEYLSKGLALYESMKHHDRIQFALAPHAPYTVSDENMQRVKAMADEQVLRNATVGTAADEKKLDTRARIHVHLHETKAEVVDSTSLTPSMTCHRSKHACCPIDNYDQNLHLLSDQLIAVHMTQLTPANISRLAATGTHVVHCPTSNLKLASGLCPVGALTAANVNVALGTDSTASNNGLDMFAEMKLAALLAKTVANDASVVPAYQALKMGTINGAKALGIDKITGSLEVGKSADFITVNMDDLESLPLFDVLSHLVYVSQRDHVQNVWVHGKRLMRNRKLTTMNEDEIKAQTKVWQKTMGEEKRKQAAAKAEASAASASKKRSATDDGEQSTKDAKMEDA